MPLKEIGLGRDPMLRQIRLWHSGVNHATVVERLCLFYDTVGNPCFFCVLLFQEDYRLC